MVIVVSSVVAQALNPTLPELHDDRLTTQTRASPDSWRSLRRAALRLSSYTTSRDTNDAALRRFR
jgi:hypothetical protein